MCVLGQCDISLVLFALQTDYSMFVPVKTKKSCLFVSVCVCVCVCVNASVSMEGGSESPCISKK